MCDDDVPDARNTDPDTSHEAAAKLNKNAVFGVILTTLRAWRALGGTTGEISNSSGIPRDSISPRMTELERQRLIHRTEARRKPPGFKRNQIVWEIGPCEQLELFDDETHQRGARRDRDSGIEGHPGAACPKAD